MGEIVGVTPGVITQVASANPILTLAVGMIVMAIILGAFLRLFRSVIRSDALDKESDSYREQLRKDLDLTRSEIHALRERLAAVEQERNGHFKIMSETQAKVMILQDRMVYLETENTRLRMQNDMQEETMQTLRSEAVEHQAKIRVLQQQVSDMKTQIHNMGGDVND
jgi:chromosome segregation ATPase